MDASKPTVYTVREVAEMLKLTEPTIREHIRAGRLESVKIGKQHRITAVALARYLTEATRN